MCYLSCFILNITHTTHTTFFFYTLQSASFHYILRNTPETCYRALKTTPETNPKTLTTANDSKVNTTLNKHRPSQPNVLKNSE